MAACGAKSIQKPKFNDSSTWIAEHSIIKEVMSEMEQKEKESLDKVKAVKTRFNWTLDKATITAQQRKQHVGIYAGDAETFKDMAPVFDKVIDRYHGIQIAKNKATEEKYGKVKLPELPKGDDIVSTRIRTARNLKSLPFTVNMTKAQRLKLEDTMKKVFATFTGTLKGKYYPMVGMDEKLRKDLVDKHFLYINDDATLELVGCYDDWPQGRGIYINDEKNHGKGKAGTFIVWVGEEDQLRIMAMNQGSDVQAVWDLFYSGVEACHKGVKALKDDFTFSGTHGYLSSCPTNIGTGMRASVHVELPGFKTKEDAKAWVKKEKMMVDIRGTRGEATDTSGCTRYDVSNKARIGSDCAEQIKTMVGGVKRLLDQSAKNLKK